MERVEAAALEALERVLARRESAVAYVRLKELAREMQRLGVRNAFSILYVVRRLLDGTEEVVDRRGRAWRKCVPRELGLARELGLERNPVVEVKERKCGRRRVYTYVFLRQQQLLVQRRSA